MSYYRKLNLSHTFVLIFILSFSFLFFTCKKFEPERVVEVKTVSIEDVDYRSCIAQGNIIDIGENGITQHGFCWSTFQNPTSADNVKELGPKSSPGEYSSSLTGLSSGTTYYLKAFARSHDEEYYGDQKSFVTPSPLPPTVETTAVSNETRNSAQSGGNVIDDGGEDITARGVCWSTNNNPSISDNTTNDGTGTGSFTSILTDLTPGTTYYVKAYATNSAGTGYGNAEPFTTRTVDEPTLTTTSISLITQTSAASGGIITEDGGGPVTERGVCWSTSENPTTADNTTNDGTGMGSFTSSLTGLSPGTTYYVRAYATNSAGTAYGNMVSFSTEPDVPTLTTTAVSSVTATTAVSGGNITSDGGAEITTRGVCWSTSTNPTTSDNITSDGIGTGSFTSNITGLTPGTTYYVRAYATNAAGTAYGSQVSFSSGAVVPTLTTTAVSAITRTSASSGGNISDNGGASITARGVCWSTSASPTTADNTTSDGIGTGGFTSSLAGLDPSTHYYVRAYATNSAGTAYGNQVEFTTDAIVVPTLTTTPVSPISRTSASSGGNITDNGGAPVTDRGVCWSTSVSPTTADNKTSDGTGVGSYTSILTGLTDGTTYYVRAYAINSAGTGYGSNEEEYTNGTGTVTDVDGNTYETVGIGTQIWMAENLKTTKYRNGIDIPLVTGNTEWVNLESPGFCWYDNDEVSYKETYGALYNWYAVNTGMLCPDGWHVPTDTEWTILEDYLGGYEVAGGKLKEADYAHWNNPNTGADNESGFTALPGGVRNHTSGDFESMGFYGDWWTETEVDINTSWFRDLSYTSITVEKIIGHKEYGFSIRCIKD